MENNSKVRSIFPAALIIGSGVVGKMTLNQIDEIQCLHVDPWTTIKEHGHEAGQWEVWVDMEEFVAYVCMSGEKHGLINNHNSPMTIMAVKGHQELAWADFVEFFEGLGFAVVHGSIS